MSKKGTKDIDWYTHKNPFFLQLQTYRLPQSVCPSFGTLVIPLHDWSVEQSLALPGSFFMVFPGHKTHVPLDSCL